MRDDEDSEPSGDEDSEPSGERRGRRMTNEVIVDN
jgi:hypothetical protein